MNDAKELRKMVKIPSKPSKETLKMSADILLDRCKSLLLKSEVAEDTKEICMYFTKINEDLTRFKGFKLDAEKESILKKAERSKELPNYAKYLPLEFAIEVYTKVPFSGLKRKKNDYDKFIILSKILEERGFQCCVRTGWSEIFFAVVLKL